MRMLVLIFNSFAFLLLVYWIIGIAKTDKTWAQTINLEEAIKLAVSSHPSVGMASAIYTAENLSITPLYFPENPKIGIMSENNIKSWTFSQELSIPTKYYYKGLAQEQRASSFKEEVEIKKLQIRQQVVAAYYELFQWKKTLELLAAQKDLIAETARIAESRRTIGQVTFQDEMRAHLEQAKLENDILGANQSVTAAKAKLEGLLGLSGNEVEIKMEDSKVKMPILTLTSEQLKALSLSNFSSNIPASNKVNIHSRISLSTAPSLKSIEWQVAEAATKKSIAKTNYWPDLMFSYQNSLKKNYDEKKYALELKIPIWFWGKEANEVQSAGVRLISVQNNLELAKRELQANLRSLAAKILSKENILKLYKTTLIPQGTSSVNSARYAYKAGKMSFIDLLENERTVYNLRISYYQELKEYAETVAEIEGSLGKSISSLPFANVF